MKMLMIDEKIYYDLDQKITTSFNLTHVD